MVKGNSSGYWITVEPYIHREIPCILLFTGRSLGYWIIIKDCKMDIVCYTLQTVDINVVHQDVGLNLNIDII